MIRRREEISLFLDNPAKFILILYKVGGRSNIRTLFDTITKEYGSSFTALYNTMHLLEKEGYIRVIENGRTKIIELTEKGKKKAELFANFVLSLEALQ